MDFSGLLPSAFGAISFGAGYLLNRWFTGARQKETIDRYIQISNLVKSMKEAGVETAHIETVQSYLIGRSEESNRKKQSEREIIQGILDIPKKVQSDSDSSFGVTVAASNESEGNSTSTVVPYEPPGYWTQSAMNARAYAAFEVSEAELRSLIVELYPYLGEDERRRFDDVNDLWIRFRDEQASLAAAQYEGGTIQPLIRSTEADGLTKDRINYLKREIAHRKSI